MALTKDKRLTRRAKWYFAIYILKSPKKRLTKSTSRNKNHERTVSRAHKENSSSGSSNKREKICNKPSFRYIRKKKKKQPEVFLLLPERLNESDYMSSSSLRKSRGKHQKTSLDETVRATTVERRHKKKKVISNFLKQKN